MGVLREVLEQIGNPDLNAELYGISVAEFSSTPSKIEPYEPGDRIIRANFVNAVKFTFSKSWGKPSLQQSVMLWQQIHEGFDWDTTLENFRAAGEENCLSEAEINLLGYAYAQQANHRDSRRKRSAVETAQEVSFQLKHISYEDKENFISTTPSPEFVEDLPSISWEELIQRCDKIGIDYIRLLRR